MTQQSGPPRTAGAGSTRLLRPDCWPGPTQRLMLAGGVGGSFIGLVLGLLSVDRPFLNGLVFYLLGLMVGVLIGAAAGLVRASVRTQRSLPADRAEDG